MNFLMTPIAVICLGLVGAACASTPAQASAWRFHPARCPDLVEDRLDRAESRRDERYDHGPSTAMKTASIGANAAAMKA